MSYFVKIILCCKHEIMLGCLCTTSLQANWKHPKHRFLQTHMEDIRHQCHYDPRL